MNLLTAEAIGKSYDSEKILFSDINFSINEGEKIGLIGINGTGKTTLLRIIAGREEVDSGRVTKGKEVRISYLSQNPVFEEEESVLQGVIKGKKGKTEFWDVEGEARKLLSRFEILNPDMPAKHLSGGERKRAALVRTLLDEADIMILDEPTNHLDTTMSAWLEDYLKKMKQALFLITHDRYFLDSVTNRIVELDKGKLYSYSGGYLKYLELKAAREEMAISTERKNAALYKKDLAWMLRGARARSTKQKAHIDRFEALKNRDKIQVDKVVQVDSLASRLGKQTVELLGLSKSYGDKKLFEDFSYIFGKKDRIGIIGNNGCGKSTLLKVICGLEKADSGSVTIGQTVKIGYFSQESGELNPNQTVIESAKDIAEYVKTADGQISISKMLERFLFEGSMQYTKIEKLSGGERRRLALLHVLVTAPNILLLDEPTNDLDIATLSILEDYIDSFEGIVIAVSHDRYFLDRIATRIFSFQEARIKVFEGNFSDYLIKTEGEEGFSIVDKPSSTKVEEVEKPAWNTGREKKLKFSYSEQREYSLIDAEIQELEEKLREIERKIEENVSNYSKLSELSIEKEKVEKDLEQKEERWLYLTELADKINASNET